MFSEELIQINYAMISEACNILPFLEADIVTSSPLQTHINTLQEKIQLSYGKNGSQTPSCLLHKS